MVVQIRRLHIYSCLFEETGINDEIRLHLNLDALRPPLSQNAFSPVEILHLQKEWCSSVVSY